MKYKTTADHVYKTMLYQIDEIQKVVAQFPWEDKKFYADWLAQSYFYVSWTTRQLALASAYTKPDIEDIYHWRFIEEAKEEKKHELLCLEDLKSMGHDINTFTELPHSSFFYQTLTYMIEKIHPVAILGYSLTLEGFAAIKADGIYQRALKAHGKEATRFLRVHCELDKDHFSNALPYLKSCPDDLLPVVEKGVRQCGVIYRGIFSDILEHNGSRVNEQKQVDLSV